MDVIVKSLVDAKEVRQLVSDMSQMQNSMSKMTKRMGILSDDCDVKRL